MPKIKNETLHSLRVMYEKFIAAQKIENCSDPKHPEICKEVGKNFYSHYLDSVQSWTNWTVFVSYSDFIEASVRGDAFILEKNVSKCPRPCALAYSFCEQDSDRLVRTKNARRFKLMIEKINCTKSVDFMRVDFMDDMMVFNPINFKNSSTVNIIKCCLRVRFSAIYHKTQTDSKINLFFQINHPTVHLS